MKREKCVLHLDCEILDDNLPYLLLQKGRNDTGHGFGCCIHWREMLLGQDPS